MSCQLIAAPYGQLWVQCLAQGYLGIAQKVFWHLPHDQDIFHVLFALGPEPIALLLVLNSLS